MKLSDFKINSYVRNEDDGEIGQVINNTLKRTDCVAVEWQNGDVSNIHINQLKLLDGDPSILEKEFNFALAAYSPEINNHIKKANEHIKKAIEISEKHKIPFSTKNLANTYGFIPFSFKEKFGSLDYSVIEKLVGFANQYGDPGWQNSSSNC